jgi:drug/metabolite transporter (DMT)-like permease
MSQIQALFATVICVLMISIGQILFKLAANQTTSLAQSEGSLLRYLTLPFLSAMVVYGLATVLWIWILRYIPLNRGYAVYSLGFVFVPLMSYLFLSESLTWNHAIGAALIIAGVVVSTRS